VNINVNRYKYQRQQRLDVNGNWANWNHSSHRSRITAAARSGRTRPQAEAGGREQYRGKDASRT
jgi:hypothetical protein